MVTATGTLGEVRLGLIGDNIAASSAPRFHRLAGAQSGLEVIYDRLVPKALNLGFDEVFEACQSGGYRGINVTYPYKERAVGKVRVDDALVRAIGAVNTVIFGGGQPLGHNTDYSGFIAAYRDAMEDKAPGAVCLIGTGGVGRAVAFGLVQLGADALHLADLDQDKAHGLARDLKRSAPHLRVTVFGDPVSAAAEAEGVINCTPLGMVGNAGTPLGQAVLGRARWAFDAVYTPVDTQFLKEAAQAGLTTISGYELFFHQAVDAWKIFAGTKLDLPRMRRELVEPGA